MTTVCLQIGNGDDKLSQAQWHAFVVELKRLIEHSCAKVHFFGAPENWHHQQNVAFVFDLDEATVENLKGEVRDLRSRFSQESAAWMQGNTLFI
jgi:hypothetical protein